MSPDGQAPCSTMLPLHVRVRIRGGGIEERMVYHHVGNGRTASVHYCQVCDGFYGVPHDARTHRHARIGKFEPGCACRACQTHFGIYPKGGVYLWVQTPRPLRAKAK